MGKRGKGNGCFAELWRVFSKLEGFLITLYPWIIRDSFILCYEEWEGKR